MNLTGPISRAFHLISATYHLDDEQILDKTLRRIRQMVAHITYDRLETQKQRRLELSWQTRSLAMVMAASGGNADEDIMRFASNLTIDNEEYEMFRKGLPAAKVESKLPVHASTQAEAAQSNFEKAADRNNFDMLALFGTNMEKGKPGE